MGKVYESTGGNYLPKIRFTAQEEAFPKNTWFIGTKVGETLGKAFPVTDAKGLPVIDPETGAQKVNQNKVFRFKVHDASPDLHIQKKNGKVWEDVELEADAEAEVNGNSQLDDKLGQVPMDQKIKATYLGKALNPNSGRYFNNYAVADAE